MKQPVIQELVDFLHYVDDSSLKERDGGTSEKLSRIHDRVQWMKESEEVGLKYMQRWEEIAYAKADMFALYYGEAKASPVFCIVSGFLCV